MPAWKLNIFTNAVITRVDNGEGTVVEVTNTYTKLTEAEKTQIINNVYKVRPDLEP